MPCRSSAATATPREYPVEKLMRDAKLLQIYEGTSQIQRGHRPPYSVGRRVGRVVLRAPDRRPLPAGPPVPRALNYLRWATSACSLTTVAVFIGHRLVDQHLSQHPVAVHVGSAQLAAGGQFVTVLATVLVGLLVELVRRLTIVSTISTFSLFLGTGVLVTALSVMSGFEQDLKGKILGTHAHMVVSTPDRSFTDYREALVAVERSRRCWPRRRPCRARSC